MPDEESTVKLPGQKEGIPLWILIGGGVLILGFILLMRQQGQGQTATPDSTGLLAAELDTRINDLWQQIFTFLENTMGTGTGDMIGPGAVGPCPEGKHPDPANPRNCIPDEFEINPVPLPEPIPIPGYPCPDGFMPDPSNPSNCIPISPAPQYRSPPPYPGLPPPAPPTPGTGIPGLPPQAPPMPTFKRSILQG